MALDRREDTPSDQSRGFGDLLRSYRVLAGLSQEQLADRSGLSAQGIGALERGERRKPFPQTVHLLAKSLGLGEAERRALVAAADRGSARSDRVDRSTAAPQPVTPDSQGLAQLPSMTLDRPTRHNLPIQLSSFIGRASEIAEVKRVLQTTRLLTMTGVGGIGKTRLALVVAADLLDAYPEGVWLVELAALANPEQVPRAVAGVLGIREDASRPLPELLADRLGARRMLLLLDNCEHLIESCAGLAQTLLRGGPHLRILTTSREALRIPGEVAWRVPSLTLPPADYLPPLDELAQTDAVHLLVERALANAQMTHNLNQFGWAFFKQGAVAQLMGERARARKLFEKAIASFKELGDRPGLGVALGALGYLVGFDSDRLVAEQLFRQSLVTLREIGHRPRLRVSLCLLGMLWVQQGQVEAGARLMSATTTSPNIPDVLVGLYWRTDFDSAVELARRRLGSDRFEAMWAQGQQLTLDEAVDEGLAMLTATAVPT